MQWTKHCSRSYGFCARFPYVPVAAEDEESLYTVEENDIANSVTGRGPAFMSVVYSTPDGKAYCPGRVDDRCDASGVNLGEIYSVQVFKPRIKDPMKAMMAANDNTPNMARFTYPGHKGLPAVSGSNPKANHAWVETRMIASDGRIYLLQVTNDQHKKPRFAEEFFRSLELMKVKY